MPIATTEMFLLFHSYQEKKLKHKVAKIVRIHTIHRHVVLEESLWSRKDWMWELVINCDIESSTLAGTIWTFMLTLAKLDRCQEDANIFLYELTALCWAA